MNTDNPTKITVLTFSGDLSTFAINKNDYALIETILLRALMDDRLSGHFAPTMVGRIFQALVDIRDDDERRVVKIDLSGLYEKMDGLEEIKNLTSLRTLILQDVQSVRQGWSVKFLSPAIGQLKNLQELDLSRTLQLFALPEEIGHLLSLKKLNLFKSSIESLPSSIGQLQNLEELNLSRTKLLLLPGELGHLVNLKRLNLEKSKIKLIPPSIGQLQNLMDLNLADMQNLSAIPIQIGNLVNLKIFDFSNSRSPPPNSIENLTNLKIIRLKNYGNDYQFLKDLTYIFCDAATVPDSKSYRCDPTNCLLKLANKLPMLGEFGRIEYASRKAKWERLGYKLACNRARSRMKFGSTNQDLMLSLPKLWPLIVSRAIHAFDPYSNNYYQYGGRTYDTRKPDAIFQFLDDGRESFIGILLNPITTIVQMAE